MSVYLPVSNLITNAGGDHAIDLDGDDQVFVLSGIAVAALGAGAAGVFSATNESNVVEIHGTLISALGRAIDLDGSYNQVFVAADGMVSGTTGGIVLGGGINTVTNLGTVTVNGDGWAVDTGSHSRIVDQGVLDATSGSGIRGTGGANYVLNEGDITSLFRGLHLANGSNRVVNTGDIISIGTLGAGHGVVFSSGSWQFDHLINRGLIAGADAAVLGGQGADFITNTGRIEGRMVLGTGDDVFVNRGTVEGDVGLDYGNDRYEGTRGSVIGTVGGGGGDDVLIGGGDADHMEGHVGADRLWGDAGADLLGGGDDADRLLGGAGDDTLEGGAGRDLLQGGDGADVLVFGAGAGRDTVVGYTRLSDQIAVDVAGVDGFGDLRIRSNAAGDAVVSWVDGSVTAGVTLVGVNAAELTAADFAF